MNTAPQFRPALIWRLMRQLNRRMAAPVIGRGRGPRGPHADWFRNSQANPRVTVQIADREFEGLAEPIVDPARIADFLLLRLQRHPFMMRVMLAMEGQRRCQRADLERFAIHKALIAIRPLEKEPNGS